MPLTYTVFASPTICDDSKIVKCGYRSLKGKRNSALVFVIKDNNLQGRTIKAPYNILIKIGDNGI